MIKNILAILCIAFILLIFAVNAVQINSLYNTYTTDNQLIARLRDENSKWKQNFEDTSKALDEYALKCVRLEAQNAVYEAQIKYKIDASKL